ncbi:Hcp family type VI secretion system effector [Nitrospirales bacterium NOB]|mgnify:CR=1 FL=1|nr:MAG: Major exported protein [Nitrospira sp. OLB3]MBV6471052.1 Major exported protein [Nitrospirota bacterium]MCE7965990.1 Hcp family type VI secretion system effector [Nitrospira sp. NTP2]MCK6493245.1 Hcp family type VI secretion system effector [Nitrospira sp.]MDL1891166.1 Hcp family type VI secretion system effector [Nitrospirales bacterium NOB]MEB2340196.1 Hcp family type VI secretion system effector [Nitrospirales bacterium]
MPIPAYLEIEGEKQGKIEGSCQQKGREGTILVQAFDHKVYIPSDPQTGLAAGKRVHGAATITKEVDKASPLLYQALCTGEHLKTITIKWYRIAKDGTEEHYFTTQFEDGIVIEMHPYMPNCLDKAFVQLGHMEEVSFRYRKAIWRHEVDKKEGQDDWNVPV